ncbi:MAG: hypothetical protein NTV05_03760 [Acidobacteria bacterium]|nr:hypothetical protein [Acidobacteriota bacterium]
MVARAIEACARVRGYAVEVKRTAEQKLRGIREAGLLLSLVQRSDGGRPLNNSSSGLTSFQFALKQAGISRQTANVWQRAAAIAEPDFERFIVDTQLDGRDLTIAELLRACYPGSEAESKACTVRFVLSDSDCQEFLRWLDILGAAHFTQTPSEAVMAIVGQAYRDWLASQARRRGPGADVVAGVA